MRWQGTLLLLALVAGQPLPAAAPEPGPVIEACVERASPKLKGLEALRAECTGLEQAIRDLKVGAFLPADWQQRISTRQLADLKELAGRYAQPAPQVQADPVNLQDIARGLPHPLATALTPWDLIKRWIPRWLVAQWPRVKQFFSRWHPAAHVSDDLLYGLMALLLVAAGVIVAIQLRAAGVFEPGEPRIRRPRPNAQPLPAEQTVDAAAIAAASTRLRPVMLLRSLVVSLSRSGRLDHERDLTCRELITTAHFDTSTQRELFARVVLFAERALYGDPGQPPPPLSDELLADAQGLTGQLLAAPHA
jgi:hypothetical protein